MKERKNAGDLKPGFEERSLQDGLLESDDLRTIDCDVTRAVEEAIEFAEASPLPEAGELLTDVYTERAAS